MQTLSSRQRQGFNQRLPDELVCKDVAAFANTGLGCKQMRPFRVLDRIEYGVALVFFEGLHKTKAEGAAHDGSGCEDAASDVAQALEPPADDQPHALRYFEGLDPEVLQPRA